MQWQIKDCNRVLGFRRRKSLASILEPLWKSHRSKMGGKLLLCLLAWHTSRVQNNIWKIYKMQTYFMIVPCLLLLLLKFVITFMQSIYTYMPETNHVSREYNVAAIL